MVEVQKPPDFILPEDLLREEVLRNLIGEERFPLLMRGSEETVTCFIPAQGLGQGQTLEFSLADAKEIATIRDKLFRET